MDIYHTITFHLKVIHKLKTIDVGITSTAVEIQLPKRWNGAAFHSNETQQAKIVKNPGIELKSQSEFIYGAFSYSDWNWTRTSALINLFLQ